MDIPFLLGTCVVGFLLAVVLGSIFQQRSSKGPLQLPLIGHIYLITDPDNMHVIFSKLAEKYGDVLYLNLIGQSWTFISNPAIAKKTTVDGRSSIYSIRPVNAFMRDFLSIDGYEDLVFGTDVEVWKRSRRLMHPLLSATAVKEYDSLIMSGVSKFIEGLKPNANGKPFDPEYLARSYPFNFIVKTLFGTEYGLTDPKFVDLVTIMKGVLDGMMFGQVTDFAPFLRYLPLPAWSNTRKWAKRRNEWFAHEAEGVKARMKSPDPAVAQKASDSFLGKLLLQMEREGANLHESQVLLILIDLVVAGVDTSSTVLMFFFCFMANHPNVLKRMQEEIAQAIPDGRPPRTEDESNLPYAKAVFNELLRLRPPAPLGIPHSVTEDDVLEGVHISKGSQVWYNAWRMNRHPQFWSEPIESFDPDRFIRFAEKQKIAPDGDVTDLKDNPANLTTFGVGRRLCPGQFLAQREIVVALASIAYYFDIEKPAGVEHVPDGGKFGMALNNFPFEIVIRERIHSK
ncbi:cytochrome P450 [Cladochytrium replicatum]|nr:cytochrome P450 [Cladochytrium replicatum]